MTTTEHNNKAFTSLSDAISFKFNGYALPNNIRSSVEEQQKVLMNFINSNTCVDPLLEDKMIFRHVTYEFVKDLAVSFIKNDATASLKTLFQSQSFVSSLKENKGDLVEIIEYSMENSNPIALGLALESFRENIEIDPGQIKGVLFKSKNYSEKMVEIVFRVPEIEQAFSRLLKDMLPKELKSLMRESNTAVLEKINDIVPEKVTKHVSSFNETNLISLFQTKNPFYFKFIKESAGLVEKFNNFSKHVANKTSQPTKTLVMLKKMPEDTAKTFFQPLNEEEIGKLVNYLANHLGTQIKDLKISFLKEASPAVLKQFTNHDSFDDNLADLDTDDVSNLLKHFAQGKGQINSFKELAKKPAIFAKLDTSSYIQILKLATKSGDTNTEDFFNVFFKIDREFKLVTKDKINLQSIFINLLKSGSTDDISAAQTLYTKFKEIFVKLGYSTLEIVKKDYEADCAIKTNTHFRELLEINDNDEYSEFLGDAKKECKGSIASSGKGVEATSPYQYSDYCSDVFAPHAVAMYDDSDLNAGEAILARIESSRKAIQADLDKLKVEADALAQKQQDDAKAHAEQQKADAEALAQQQAELAAKKADAEALAQRQQAELADQAAKQQAEAEALARQQAELAAKAAEQNSNIVLDILTANPIKVVGAGELFWVLKQFYQFIQFNSHKGGHIVHTMRHEADGDFTYMGEALTSVGSFGLVPDIAKESAVKIATAFKWSALKWGLGSVVTEVAGFVIDPKIAEFIDSLSPKQIEDGLPKVPKPDHKNPPSSQPAVRVEDSEQFTLDPNGGQEPSDHVTHQPDNDVVSSGGTFAAGQVQEPEVLEN